MGADAARHQAKPGHWDHATGPKWANQLGVGRGHPALREEREERDREKGALFGGPF